MSLITGSAQQDDKKADLQGLSHEAVTQELTSAVSSCQESNHRKCLTSQNKLVQAPRKCGMIRATYMEQRPDCISKVCFSQGLCLWQGQRQTSACC